MMGCSDGKGPWDVSAGGTQALWAGRAVKEPGDFWRMRGDG